MLFRSRLAEQVGVGREAVLRLGHADREVAVALALPLLELVAHLLVGDRAGSAVDLLADGVDLVEQRQLLVVERLEVGGAAVGQSDHLLGQLFGALGALAPEIGRASCRERCVSTCRSRWSPYTSKKKQEDTGTETTR